MSQENLQLDTQNVEELISGVEIEIEEFQPFDPEKISIDTKGITMDTCLRRLYGEKPNTIYLENYINEYKLNKLKKYDYMMALFKNPKTSNRFRKGFEAISVQIQDAIIQKFEDAIKREGQSPLYADGDLIKDVTSEKEKKITVHELRIFDPAAYRVYFHETSDYTYLALIEPKPPKKTQNNQIQTAHDIIKELIITNQTKKAGAV